MASPNAIERTLRNPSVQKHYGKDHCEALIKQMNRWCPLDDKMNAPLPEWACEILRVREIGFRTRYAILVAHHYDITGDNIDYARLTKGKMALSPPREVPDWLTEFRERQAAKAREYLKRKEQENNNGLSEV